MQIYPVALKIQVSLFYEKPGTLSVIFPDPVFIFPDPAFIFPDPVFICW